MTRVPLWRSSALIGGGWWHAGSVGAEVGVSSPAPSEQAAFICSFISGAMCPAPARDILGEKF